MNKKEMINEISTRTGLGRVDVESVMSGLTETLVEMASRGDQLTIRGLGTFKGKERKARQIKNPKSGEVINLPARKVLTFKATSSLKL